jgi:N-acetylmuramoyl-L-alanine amidase
MLLTCRVVYSYELDSKLVGKVIVLDAGHGGKDKGTSVNGVYESDINLALVLKLKNELSKHGVDVILTRDGDYDLSSPNAFRRKKSDFDNRINLINNSGAHLYLSIHINYLNDTRYYGAQVFYTDSNEMLAKSIQECLDSPLSEKKLSNTIYMYKKLSVPGVLIECGFLSNDNERRLLQDNEYQNKLVESIVKGVLKYY